MFSFLYFRVFKLESSANNSQMTQQKRTKVSEQDPNRRLESSENFRIRIDSNLFDLLKSNTDTPYSKKHSFLTDHK